MTQQLNGLAGLLGRVDMPAEEPAPEPENPAADSDEEIGAEREEPTLEEAIDALADN
jgi:hypothetical protein